MTMRAFGPVPSRRLGKSLGINNIPPKTCSYACVYCQLRTTGDMGVDRRAFHDPEELADEVGRKAAAARSLGEETDYLTFVPDGEPTLDINLGRHMELLAPLDIPIAVISNASLIWRKDVRDELAGADWVSLKADAATEEIWHRVNRPHGRLDLEKIQQGMLDFAETFGGTLVTETMLVGGVNDGAESLEAVAGFLARLEPDISYLSIPTRPPAETDVGPPDEETVNRAFAILDGKLDRVEYLIGYEGNAFAFTGNIEDDLLSITSVHPMRDDAVEELLRKAEATWSAVESLLRRGLLVETELDGHRFYLRKLG
jgi:wyosine [tRNA(Phe)-imidazoG37] synthetase (radical SAM superfamily)